MRKVDLGCRVGREAGGPRDSVQSRDAMWACLIFVPEQFSMFRKKIGKKKPAAIFHKRMVPSRMLLVQRLPVLSPGGRGPLGSLLAGEWVAGGRSVASSLPALQE